MQSEARREADEWLQRAQRDLLIAERALQGTPTLAEQAAYHAQQAAEKVLKAFLAANNQTLQKTHNVEQLVTQCQAIDPRFGDFLASARTLNPYATLFRYPGGPLEPAVDEAKRAMSPSGSSSPPCCPRIPGSLPLTRSAVTGSGSRIVRSSSM